MDPKKPLFPPRKEKKTGGGDDPWNAIRDLTEHYGKQISDLLNKSKSASRALFECLEAVYTQVHDPRDGDDGQTHMDEFDHREFEKQVSTVLDVFLFQELANMFGLEKSVKSRAIEAYILRHPNLRPLIPGKMRQAQSPAAQPQAPTSKPTPPPRTRPKMWTGKK